MDEKEKLYPPKPVLEEDILIARGVEVRQLNQGDSIFSQVYVDS